MHRVGLRENITYCIFLRTLLFSEKRLLNALIKVSKL